MLRVTLEEGLEEVGGTSVGEGAARGHIGDDNEPAGIQDLGRLGHEHHAGEDDHIGVGLCGGLSEGEAVADMIGQVLDLAVLIVVGEDHGPPLFAEAGDLGEEIQADVDLGAHGTPSFGGLRGPLSKRTTWRPAGGRAGGASATRDAILRPESMNRAT